MFRLRGFVKIKSVTRSVGKLSGKWDFVGQLQFNNELFSGVNLGAGKPNLVNVLYLCCNILNL